MDRRTPAPQGPAPGGHPVDPGPDPDPRPATPPQGGSALNVGPILARTVRHFWPDFNDRLDAIPDPRRPDRVVYHKRFLLWWGLALFLCELGSRRQLDYQLAEENPAVLDNLNRLAGTRQRSRPVNKTLDNFLGGCGSAALADLRTGLVRDLLRGKAFDAARLLGHRLVLIDGTVHLTFRRPHCPHCLVQRHGSVTRYSHQVLEAKLAGPAGVVASVGTEFIANADLADTPSDAGAERRKQDCELKAWHRLAAGLKRDFPQLPVCVGGDALYACAPVMAACEDNGWAYVLTLKPGRLPTVWQEFQALLPQCPGNRVEWRTPQGAEQVYRWVGGLSHAGEGGRIHTFSAIECKETVNGVTTTWAWVTRLPVTRSTVVEVAQRGGRGRWCIENEGFNAQKNSGLNLEHAYSEGQEQLKAFYYLLQIAHLLMQLVEKGSLLRRLAAESGRTVLGLFGSLKNIAQRLLESLRFTTWPEECCGAAGGRGIQIRLGLDSS